jgi:hypothetical protein
MSKRLKLVSMCLLAIAFYSCGPSIKVTDTWKAPDATSLRSETFLVIAKTDDMASRQLFEQEIVSKMKSEGINATPSYTKYPKVKHNQKLTEEQISQLEATFKKDGFGAIVLTVLKDVKTEVITEESGGYSTGGYYPGFYGGYGGFGRYYGSFYSPYGYGGAYVPRSQRTYESEIYKLETVIYDLSRSENKQLVAVVSTNIKDPGSASAVAAPYAKKVLAQFKEKKK